MNFSGKIIGVILGSFFGPLTALLGLVLGHLYDIGFFERFSLLSHRQTTNHYTETQSIFFDTTFAVLGYVAKCDGRVTEKEIAAAREVMAQFNLNATLRERAMKQFYSGTHPHFNLTQRLLLLRHTCFQQPALLQTFVEIQMHMANSETMTAQKQGVLQHICAQLGIYSTSNQHHYRHEQRPSTTSALADAFQLLGVASSATKDEVKKAYRRQMSQHHPDKLIAKGLPPHLIKAANQKTAQIKKAYETIKQAKGW